MSEPWRQAMARIVLHGAELGRDAECIRDPLGRALVVGRKETRTWQLSRIELLGP